MGMERMLEEVVGETRGKKKKKTKKTSMFMMERMLEEVVGETSSKKKIRRAKAKKKKEHVHDGAHVGGGSWREEKKKSMFMMERMLEEVVGETSKNKNKNKNGA